MKILVLGSTGVLGRNVIPRLIERKHKVRVIVRHTKQARFLEQMGAETKLGDIFDLKSLDQAAHGCEAVLHLATAIPKSGEQDWSLNDRVRREGTRNLVTAAVNNGVKQYIQQSIALLYGERGQQIVDETAALQVSPISESSAEMEAIVQASKLDWSILRGGIFYGHGTGREEGWRQLARNKTLVIPGDGSDLISLIHVVDYARAIVAATENAPAGGIYNIVDDEPVSYKELFTHIAVQQEAGLLRSGGEKFLPSLGCTNTLAKKALNWQPVYPTYRSGLS